VGIRNGKKVTTKNVRRLGKHSELLKITDDPLSYAREEIRKMNEEYRIGKVEYTISADYSERVERTDDEASTSTELNIGYFLVYSRIMDIVSRASRMVWLSSLWTHSPFMPQCSHPRHGCISMCAASEIAMIVLL